MTIEKNGRTYLRRKMPTYLFFAVISLVPGCLWVCYETIIRDHQFSVPLATLILVFIPLSSIYAIDRRYEVSWDYNHLYMRGWKCAQLKALSEPEVALEIADIRHVRGIFLDRKSQKRLFMPFEAIEIAGRSRHDGTIIVNTPSFYHSEVKQLMSYLYFKTPKSFSKEIMPLVDQ